MTTVVASIFSILFGFCVLLVGSGLLNTLLGLRAGFENFSDAVIGVIMSGYFLGFIIGTYYCPGIIRRVGHIRAYAAMAAGGATLAFLHVLLVEPNTWLALRVITGICLVGLYMIIESWINAIAPDQYRSRLFAAYMMATLVAVAIGPYLIVIDGGKTAVSFGIAALLFSAGLLPVVLTKVKEPSSIAVPKLKLKSLFQASPAGMIGATASGLANSAFFGMGAVFAQRLNFSEQNIALFMSLLVLGGACLQWPIGHLSDNRDRRKVLAVVCYLAAFTAFAAYIVSEKTQILFILVFIYGGMAFTVYPLSVALVNDHIESDDFLDAARSILLMYGIGATMGPVIAGLLMQLTGPKSLLLLMAGMYLGTAIFVFYHGRREIITVSAEEQSSFTPMVRTSQAALNLHPEVSEENPDSEGL